MTGHQTNACIPWAFARGMHALDRDMFCSNAIGNADTALPMEPGCRATKRYVVVHRLCFLRMRIC